MGPTARGNRHGLFKPLPPKKSDEVDETATAKRRRVSRPKARTGCLTCKRRHLRCDERKPTCARCENADIECTGYLSADALEPKKPKEKVTTARTLLPRPATPSGLDDLGHVSLMAPGIKPLDGEDMPYFDLFRHHLVRNLSGHTWPTFWCRTVVRESLRDECIRHSVIAFSALFHGLYLGPDALPGDANIPISAALAGMRSIRNEHHEAALYHHTRAVSMFRERIESQVGDTSPRTMLIATLLFVAYELMQGDIKAADDLSTKGVVLLQDSLRQRNNPDGRLALADDMDDDMDEIAHLLPTICVCNSFSPFCFQDIPSKMGLLPTDVLYNLPGPGDSLARTMSLWSDFVTGALAFVSRHMWLNAHNSPFDVEAARHQQAEFLAQLGRWNAYVEALWQAAWQEQESASASASSPSPSPVSGTADGTDDADDDSPTLRSLTVVKVHILVAIIEMTGCLDQSGLVFDALTPLFREVVEHSRIFLDLAHVIEGLRFIFSVGITPGLGLVIAQCRDAEVRALAIDTFRRLTWREGAWDARAHMIGRMAQVALENAGADNTGFIPAVARYTWTAASWDVEGGKLMAEYTRNVPDERGLPVRIQMALEIHDNQGSR